MLEEFQDKGFSQLIIQAQENDQNVQLPEFLNEYIVKDITCNY